MMSITWIAPAEEETEFAGSDGTEFTVLVDELLTDGTDSVSKKTEPIPCSNSQTIFQFEDSSSDGTGAAVGVSEQREGEMQRR